MGKSRCRRGVIDEYGTPLPEHVIDAIKRNKIAIKGPVTTPVGKGFKSVNVTLRQTLDLYVNLRPVKSFKGIKSRYEDIDLVIVRENTEGLYSGIEHKIGDYGAETIKIITKPACERICEFAFNYAKDNNRKKVTGVHKANIMKLSDGLFLNTFRDIASKYPDIKSDDLIVDAACMNLVINPEKYDVMVMPNLYGDIVSDLCSGLVGGLGMIPRYLGEQEAAAKIENALIKVFEKGENLTGDLGGNATTDEFTNEILKYI